MNRMNADGQRGNPIFICVYLCSSAVENSYPDRIGRLAEMAKNVINAVKLIVSAPFKK
jgi:hypothetical protein